jgi:hypothetical protein
MVGLCALCQVQSRKQLADKEIVQFVETFKAFPPRSFPPSFVPTTIMDELISTMKEKGVISRALR